MQTSKVIVGISGGVDSAVAAWRLQEQGFVVEGLFMKNWEDDDDADYCAAAEDLDMARRVCEQLQIPLHTANFAAEYWQHVFRHFLHEYEAGRTPNPDILCNTEIKFKLFPEFATRIGASKIATGHYAQIEQVDDAVQLRKGVDPNKDQSYFLHGLNRDQLKISLFPLGVYTKNQVREQAKLLGLSNYDRKDSTGICFIGERRFREFLSRYLPATPGPIVTPDGAVVGEHHGVYYYTLGQRQGLGIGGQKNTGDAAWYVADKNVVTNTLTVVQGHDHPLLFSNALTTKRIHWISGSTPAGVFRCFAKTRYRQADQPCKVEPFNNGWRITFEQRQRAVTPGQYVVLYQDDICLGGGIIDAAESVSP